MAKQFPNFISLLSYFKKIRIVLGLTVIFLLLSGSLQTFAVSSRPDEKAGLKENNDQQKIISGRVTDDKGQALPGVNIVEKGTTNGAISDADGRYTISVASANSVLVFSFVGYTSLEVT
ncbi:MAG: carboxypeptidase-like regulatory domain-containing protein, partial [Bacteroidales bacterium]|nr:carboxypeptidase-like regulatory domain-containing protein [Bacteroidales bacterium]